MTGTASELFEHLVLLPQSLAALPGDGALRLGAGLLLMLLIIRLILHTPPTSPPAVQPSSTCLRCGHSLAEHSYVDRHLPSWVICTECYARLSGSQQRQYRAR